MKSSPQPTALKRARGNPGKRPLNRKEPPAQVGLPSCPDHFPEEIRRRWETLGSVLVRLGVMTELDGEAFADLLETERLNRDLTIALRGAAPIETSSHGETKKNPLWSLKLEYLRERRAQHEKFGMTPASRSKITATDARPMDPLEDAIN